jgi:hypothetical protein
MLQGLSLLVLLLLLLLLLLLPLLLPLQQQLQLVAQPPLLCRYAYAKQMLRHVMLYST